MSNNIRVDYSPVLNALDAVNSNIEVIRGDIIRVEGQVGNMAVDLDSTRNELRELRKAFEKYAKESERTAAVQRAETKIGNLKAELDRQYGHYAVVRRASVGVLQAFDVGNVTNEVVSQVSEELMIQSPRYWLAPALVGLAAWSRDDQEICEKSIKEAYNRDQAKTSLFFALVLRRVKRTDAANQWLKHYLMTCDSGSLTREFAVILEAAAEGAFGPIAERILSEKLHEWNRMLRQQPTVVEAQTEEWNNEFMSNKQQLVTDDYAKLAQLSPDFPRLRTLIESATALGVFADKYEAIRDVELQTTDRIEDALDDLLEQLVTEYDEEELPIRRDVAYNEAILDTHGDLDAAKVKADQYVRALEETLDAVTLQTRAAINPELLGVSINTQRVAIGTGLEDVRAGLAKFTKGYRADYLDAATIILDENHSGFAQQFNFGRFTTSTAEDEQTSLNRLKEQWNAAFQGYIQQVQFTNVQMVLPIIAAILIVLVMGLGGIISALLGLILGAGGAAFWIYTKKTTAERKVAEAETARENAFLVSRDLLLETRAEFLDLHLEYHDLDQDEEKAKRLLDTWPTTMQKVSNS